MKFNILKIVGLLILISITFSCVDPTPRRPVNHKKESYIQKSIQLNKKINVGESKIIKEYIKQDSLNSYNNSSSGFWYTYLHKNASEERTPKLGEIVLFEYEIYDLSNTLIYSKEELGQVSYYVDKEDLESGLQEGLKLMKEGEEIKFIFPSFKAYGFTGDRKKIGVKQPLIYKVKLININ